MTAELTDFPNDIFNLHRRRLGSLVRCRLWGRVDLNYQLCAYQAHTLPIELQPLYNVIHPHEVVRDLFSTVGTVGIEPTHVGFKVQYLTTWRCSIV